MTNPNSITGTVAIREQGGLSMIQRRSEDFFNVLPEHITNKRAWLRLAESAVNRTPQLQQAAANDPGALMRALMNCATLGHLPGSDRFYLVPVKGKIEGWESYKGLVQRILNSGNYLRVIAEVVYEGETFKFNPNRDTFPDHEIDYMARSGGGKPLMSYAYAIQNDGTPTKIAIADPGYIKKVKGASMGASGASSPWNKWGDEMYLKCAIKRLEPWVEASNEDRRSTTAQAERTDQTVVEVDEPTIEVIDGEYVVDGTTPVVMEPEPEGSSIDGL